MVVGQRQSWRTGSTSLPGELGEDDALIASVVGELNEVDRRTGLLRAVAFARVVLDAFFGGSVEEFATRSCEHTSFRALAQREDLEVSFARLVYSVRIAVQLEHLPDEVARDLSLAHHRALLVVHDVVEKCSLAFAALELGWTSKRLREEIHLRGGARGPTARGGRPRLPPWERVIRGIDKILEEHGTIEGFDGDWESAREAAIRLERQIERLSRLRRALIGRVS